MAEILSQEERDALLKTISAGYSEEEKKGGEKEKTNPGAESSEHLEKKERVLTLIHDFYQERQKNMPVHREIIELADNLKNFLEKAIYFGKKYFKTTENRVADDLYSNKERRIVGIRFMTEGEKGIEFEESIIENLEMVLNNVDLKEEEKKNLEELINNIQKTESELDNKVNELWEIRKNTAKEIILASPEFENFKDAELDTAFTDRGLYNLDSCVKAKKELEIEEGRKEKFLFFETDDLRIEKALKNLTEKFNITEQELKEIKGLEWSEEEKIKLKKFRKEVENYKEKSAEIAKSFLETKKTFEFDAQGAENIKIEMTRAFVRGRYKENGLPSVHKTRVVQEIMNGTFKWPE